MFVVQLFSNQLFLIIVVIVHFPNTGNVLQVFRSRNQRQHCESINIIHCKICTWFRPSIGLLKAYCPVVASQDIRNKFLRLGSKWARDTSCPLPWLHEISDGPWNVAGSAVLVLSKPLDKESVTGPSSLTLRNGNLWRTKAKGNICWTWKVILIIICIAFVLSWVLSWIWRCLLYSIENMSNVVFC